MTTEQVTATMLSRTVSKISGVRNVGKWGRGLRSQRSRSTATSVQVSYTLQHILPISYATVSGFVHPCQERVRVGRGGGGGGVRNGVGVGVGGGGGGGGM